MQTTSPPRRATRRRPPPGRVAPGAAADAAALSGVPDPVVLCGAADRPAQAVLAAARVVLDAAPASVEQATDKAQLAAVTHHVLAADATLEELAGGGGLTAAMASALAARAQLTAADALAGLGATTRARHALAATRRLAADVGDAADRDDLLHTALRVEGKMHAYGLLAGPVPPALAGCDPTTARTPAQVAVAFQAARLGAHAWPPDRVQEHLRHALDAAGKLPATGATGVYVARFSPANALYHALVAWADCGATPLAEQHYPQVAASITGHPVSLAVAEYAMARLYFDLGRLAEAAEHTRRARHADPGHRACRQAQSAARAAASAHRADP